MAFPLLLRDGWYVSINVILSTLPELVSLSTLARRASHVSFNLTNGLFKVALSYRSELSILLSVAHCSS